MSTSKKRRLLVILGFILYVSLVIEGLARVAFRIPQVSKRLRADDEYTWRRDWVGRHQKDPSQIYYTFDVFDRSKGWALKPNIKDMTAFGGKTLNTNSHGLRGRKEFSYGKSEGTLRILTLGDSFTFGEDVSDDETYAQYLQQMLPEAEVINLGVHGYGHDQMLIHFKEEGVKYKPDIVILGFIAADMTRNVLAFRDFAKPRFVLRSGHLEPTGTPVSHPEEILKSDWMRPRTVDVLSILRYYIDATSRRREMSMITRAILLDMVTSIESIHAVPVFAYLPVGREIQRETAGEYEQYMFRVCQADKRVRCFSLRPYFAEKIANGETFSRVGHWDPHAHRTAAEAIKDYLADEGLTARPQARTE